MLHPRGFDAVQMLKKPKTQVIMKDVIMAAIYPILAKEKNFFSSKRNRYLTIGSIIGICLLLVLKGCNWENVFEKEYYIGQDSRWHNLNLMGKERNFSAFNNDLLAAIARKEKFGIRIVVTPSSELIPNLEKEKLQGALISLQPSYLHENLIFSEPYYLTGPVLIIPSTAPIEGWNEKRRKIVGVPAASHTLLSLEQDPTIQIKFYEDIFKALSDLSERKIDGAIFPAIPAYTYVSTFYKNELKIATLPLNDEGVRLAALKSKEGEELIKRFNAGLASLKQSGAFLKMLEQWGLINTEQALNNKNFNQQ